MTVRLGEFFGKIVMTIEACYAFPEKAGPIIRLEAMQPLLCVGIEYATPNRLRLLHGEELITMHIVNLVGFKNTEALVGYRLCLTGDHRQWPRNVLIRMIEHLGGEVVESPAQANHILKGDVENDATKLRIAVERGIKIATLSELFNSLGDSILFGIHYC